MNMRSSNDNTVIEALSKAPLWAGLNIQDLKLIAKLSKERKYAAGDVIVKKGDLGVGFYLLVDGAVDIKSDGAILAKLGPGQFFGEMSLLDNQPRSADAIATEPSTCRIISVWSFKALISDNPRIAFKMLRELARRLRKTDTSLDKSASA